MMLIPFFLSALFAQALTLPTTLDSLKFGPGHTSPDSSSLGIDPSFRWEVGFNPDPISNVSLAALCIMGAERLALGELGQRIPPKTLIDPSRNLVQIAILPDGDAIDFKYVLWGLLGIMEEWVARGTAFTEGGLTLYTGTTYLGALVIYNRPVGSGSVGGDGQAGGQIIELSLPKLPEEGTEQGATGSNMTSSLSVPSNDPRLRTRTTVLPNAEWLGQGRVFITAINAIVGLLEVETFTQTTSYVFKNRVSLCKLEGGPPQGGPRRSAPYNTRDASIETFGRFYAEMLLRNRWVESQIDVYYDSIKIATWYLRTFTLPGSAIGGVNSSSSEGDLVAL